VDEANRFVEVVDLAGEPGGVIVDDDQGVDRDAGIEEQAGCSRNLCPGRPASGVAPVAVVDVFGTVDQDAVRLQSVANRLALAESGFELDGLPEEFEAHERRFAALPADGHRRDGLGEELLQRLFEDSLAHPVDGRLGEERVLFAIETVFAGEVAVRPGWLDQDGGQGFLPGESRFFHVESIIISGREKVQRKAGFPWNFKKMLDFCSDI
jgi:hypothetical protein